MTALTDHQAKLFALELKRRHPVGDSARIGSALIDAQVDLNPHQVDAALFAFRSPFSKGVILADEVGLGKTIEAGLVLTQRWAERRRRVIVVVPASLRKQWVAGAGGEVLFAVAHLGDQVVQRRNEGGGHQSVRPSTRRAGSCRLLLPVCGSQGGAVGHSAVGSRDP